MAIIGKIQRNSILLLVVIGLAMFAFIYTEYQSGTADNVDVLPFGTAYGEALDEEEYDYIVESYTTRDRQNSMMQGREYDATAEQQTKDQAFNEVVRRELMNREFEKLQLVCTTQELNDMIHGNHVHPWVMQIPIFQGPMGFSKDSVRSFINNLEVEPEDETMRENWLAARKQWSEFEKELKDTRMADKYVTLIKKGLYVNSLEAKDQYYADNHKKKIRFVIQRYTDIPQDEITVTDEDIKAFYEEHKHEKQYEQEESRDIEYVSFPIMPTAEDVDQIISDLELMKADFAKTENNLAFMQSHSSTPFNSDTAQFRMGSDQLVFDTFFGNNQYPASADDQIQAAKIGDVIGPFVSGRDYAIAKVTGIKKEMQAWVRHILIKVDATQTDAYAKALSDSLVKVINAQDNFVEMVQKYTQDPGSIPTNGEYKWFSEGRMVPEFNDASFKGAIGKLQVVKTTYGYHIIEVLGRGERVVPSLAVVTKAVKASENTKKLMEEKVFDFIYAVNESKEDSAFHFTARDSNFTINPTRVWLSNNFVMGINKSERILRFAFNKDAQEKTISDPILDDDKYVVAYLSNIIPEGAPEFEDVKDQMRYPALKDKQAKVYMEKMAGKNSLEEIIPVMKNGQIVTAEVYFSSNVIQGGGGNEPEVIGKLFTKIPTGSMTKPIKGNTGVYVIIIESETQAPETTDYSVSRNNLLAARAGSADGLVIRALREKADVIDNRRRLELQ
ncbi:MAG: peptidylprolyl isomerase [Bacteroidetes bacterium]|nr:peptidylprolyl isomerase [Bacteroidota bacterium]